MAWLWLKSHLFLILSIYDKSLLLVEFVAGEFPNMADKRFAEGLGHILARLHSIAVGNLPHEACLAGQKFYLDCLNQWSVISDKQVDHILNAMTERFPENFITSMIYADIKPQNYCWAEDGSLILFDFGSFQSGQITDGFLLGSSVFEIVDRNSFISAYKSSGGDCGWLAHEPIIRSINNLRMTWFYESARKRLPVTAIRKRRAYRQWSREARDRLLTTFGL